MNIGQIMKQMQGMQAKMADMQSRLTEIEVEGQSGGGMVSVVKNGKGEVKKTKIDPKLASAAELDMLEDLVTAAYNDAKGRVDRHVAGETEKMMGGLQLPPGVKLPF
jgi:DNA-binding YbaB/EbfC family protein